MSPLIGFTPNHDFFIGIDSDGCAFNTMEIKQKECFIPNIIKHWGLQPVSEYVCEVAEFVNLYSKWRGINRWLALVMVFDLLREHPKVQARGIIPPTLPRIREFIADEAYSKSDKGLKEYLAEYPDPELEKGLAWTTSVNAAVADVVRDVPPYAYVQESLERIAQKTDTIVISTAPVEELTYEWQKYGLAQYVRLIAGQEMGKKEHLLGLVTKDKYKPNYVLMIGDAPSDMKAAQANNALFYPIHPGYEEESWQRFYAEAFDKFITGEYVGEYETTLIVEFEELLSDAPPWVVTH